MLQWLGEKEAADILPRATQETCSLGVCTPDLGGKATTVEVATAVVDQIQKIAGKA